MDAGSAALNLVPVLPDAPVVDSLGRVVSLTLGVNVALAEGAFITYTGQNSFLIPQLVVTFTLKQGLLWSDGAPLTAADSVFSYELARHPDSFDSRRARAERTASYRALDSVTVQWVGLPGYIDPLYYTNFWTPFPKHLYPDSTPPEVGDSRSANESPLGWGAFVLQEWVKGDHLTFTRNPNYFRAAEGLPHFDTLTYRLVSPDSFAADFQSGACDLIPSPTFATHSSPDNTLTHLDFNTEHFPDPATRRALAQCLDPTMSGAALPVFLPSMPAHPLLAPDILPLPFDPALARATLANAPLPAPLTLAFAAPLASLAATLQAQLQTNCGLEVELRSLTLGELTADWPAGFVFGRHFDLALFTWKIGAIPPCALYTTAQIADENNPAGANASGYSNPAFDSACQRALTTLNPVFAAQYHAEAQKILAQDLPMISLSSGTRLVAVRPEVQNFALDPTSPSVLWNIEALAGQP